MTKAAIGGLRQMTKAQFAEADEIRKSLGQAISRPEAKSVQLDLSATYAGIYTTTTTGSDAEYLEHSKDWSVLHKDMVPAIQAQDENIVLNYRQNGVAGTDDILRFIDVASRTIPEPWIPSSNQLRFVAQYSNAQEYELLDTLGNFVSVVFLWASWQDETPETSVWGEQKTLRLQYWDGSQKHLWLLKKGLYS